MGQIVVTDRNGDTRLLEAVSGWRVMEILRDHGVGVSGLCGGQCDCGTCHVVVDEAWVSKLHPARDDEAEALDGLPIIADTSRLSCQLIWDESLDGLTLTLAEE